MRGEHSAHGLDDQFEVDPGAALLDIEQVEVDPFVEGDGVAVATGLPIAGEAGLNQQTLMLVVVISRDFSRQRRPRSDDGHIAL